MWPVTLGRNNYLFMGSEAGGKSAAIAYTLIETAKMNHVNPEAWFAWVLECIQDHPASRIKELLPWEYQVMIEEEKRKDAIWSKSALMLTYKLRPLHNETDSRIPYWCSWEYIYILE